VVFSFKVDYFVNHYFDFLSAFSVCKHVLHGPLMP
jgi:hypothetical protein